MWSSSSQRHLSPAHRGRRSTRLQAMTRRGDGNQPHHRDETHGDLGDEEEQEEEGDHEI